MAVDHSLTYRGRALKDAPHRARLRTIERGYRLSGLPSRRCLFLRYLLALLNRRRFSHFRDRRQGRGTHFGFDDRDVDAWLRRQGVSYRAFNRTTRFYLLNPPAAASAALRGLRTRMDPASRTGRQS